MTTQVYSSAETDSAIAVALSSIPQGPLGQDGSSINWLHVQDGRFGASQFAYFPDTADRSGTINIDTALPNLIPSTAKAVILGVEFGWQTPPLNGNGVLALRIMPHGHSMSDVLDIWQGQSVCYNGIGLNLRQGQILLPVDANQRTFFYNLESTQPTRTGKSLLLFTWGWVG